jgi:acetyl esterase/lipase
MPSGISHKIYNIDDLTQGEWIYEKEKFPQFDEKNLRSHKCIFYIHGGAFCCGKSGTHRGLLYRMAKCTNCVIFAVDYKRPPEYPYPIPIDDCIRSYLHILNYIGDPNKIIFAGDSAGGNLVISTLSKLEKDCLPLPSKAILLSPWVDLTDIGRHDSWKRNHKYDIITKTLAKLFAHSYASSDEQMLREASPVYFDNLHKLPPLLVEYGEYEVLHDQIKEFCEIIKQSGVNLIENIRGDMIHVFPIYHATGIKQSKDFFKAVGEFCSS